jgi:hypothetical protein|nr:MAG TPA: hypothetical protein [Caudoviricetes sp.]
MKNLKNALFIVLLGFTIYLCFRNYKLSREVNSLEQAINEIPDTVYKDKPFIPEKKYSEDIEPGRILIYNNRQSNLNDTLFSNPLLRQPVISKQDSLVQMVLKKNQLNLSLFNQQTGTYSTRLFNIDLDKYNYNWYEGQLTRKKVARLSLKPYVYGKYRPFNNLFDMGAGLSIKTKRFNYKLGVNTFYYPKIKSGIGTDLEFQITYNF